MVGAWTEFSVTMSSEDKSVFQEALNGLTGVDYNPLCVAHQVVQGTNYKFFCNAKVVYPDAPNKAAIVEIYKPLQDKAHIVSIEQI